MTKTTFLFYTNCRAAGREQELSEWYDNIHIPDVEAIPGFAACARYRLTNRRLGNVGPSQEIAASYLSIVETNLDADTAIARLSAAVADWASRGRMSDLFEVVASEIVTEENPSHASDRVTAA